MKSQIVFFFRNLPSSALHEEKHHHQEQQQQQHHQQQCNRNLYRFHSCCFLPFFFVIVFHRRDPYYTVTVSILFVIHTSYRCLVDTVCKCKHRDNVTPTLSRIEKRFTAQYFIALANTPTSTSSQPHNRRNDILFDTLTTARTRTLRYRRRRHPASS